MPLYEFECENCEEKFDVLFKSMSEKKIVICPKCNNIHVKKVMSAPAIHFKGAGWTGKGRGNNFNPLSEPGMKQKMNVTEKDKILYKNTSKSKKKLTSAK